MGIRIDQLDYDGNNTKFLESVIEKLGKKNSRNILYRASEQESLERILKHGTDRGGFSGKKSWGYSELLSKELLHEDVIFATTEAEIRYGEQNLEFQTSLKKFSLIERPLLLVYDSSYFIKVKEKQYAFKNPKTKHESLIAVFTVTKLKTSPEKNLYVVTGAHDCGKTATLEFLRGVYGYNIQKEAASLALDDLGSKKLGHDPCMPLKKIYGKRHICPVCTPLKFAKLALKKQKELEKLASEGSLLERGYVDIIEFYTRHNKTKDLKHDKFADYANVFLLEVMPSLQEPKWGKSKQERTEEARRINDRLLKMYTAEGFNVSFIPAGSVEERAKRIHERISKNL
ncbi:ATP-binding protein [Candidatus Woesearchaeota archaeon]|nr:ATP-binding protein [Candidatus Woesearchaeota archaeon]